MKPLFSIITVCYNSEGTILSTLESVLIQSFKNYEYIIVDNMSKDNTVNIINEYKEKFDGKIKVISEKDTGIYNAMNKGIANASGEWIIFLNSDDWFQSDSLIKVKAAIEKNPNLDFLYGNINRIWTYKGELYFKELKAGKDLHNIKRDMMFSHESLFVKKKIFSQIGCFDEKFKIAADWDFIIRMYNNNLKYKNIDVIVSNFRVDGASSKPHNWEKHKVRKKNRTYNYIDFYLIKDLYNFLKMRLINSLFKKLANKKRMANYKKIKV